MSSTKICSVFATVLALCVTSLVEAGPVGQVSSHQTAAKQQGGAVLFFTAHQGRLTDLEFNPIIFNQVLLNQGSAYNNVTGVFTAPVAGIYQFVFAAQLCRGSHNNVWHFMVNGEKTMACHAQVTGGDTTLNTCYLMEKLKKDDQVWINQNIGSCAWGSIGSKTITFSGLLLTSEGVSMLGGKSGFSSSCVLPSLNQHRKTASSSPGQSATLSSMAITLLLCCLLWD
uniref:complement C1q tumor necrosis factor-related protein 5-like n=1 Tax=Scatophagus argus TaxID=75038 RepID=UPI001ED7D6D8|nr:complement C1q tumor necrosis factor-related protein 5-like [Scatophagus argus]